MKKMNMHFSIWYIGHPVL